mgnify:CR=1 FL=1
MNPEDVAAMHEDLERLRRPTLALLDGADAIDYTPDGELVDYVESGELDGFRHESEVIIAAMEWLAPDREEEL